MVSNKCSCPALNERLECSYCKVCGKKFSVKYTISGLHGREMLGEEAKKFPPTKATLLKSCTCATLTGIIDDAKWGIVEWMGEQGSRRDKLLCLNEGGVGVFVTGKWLLDITCATH